MNIKLSFGKYKGSNLKLTNLGKTRPTQSIAKSIIFNILKIDDNTKVLELFAGSGSLGFESLSLGAKEVVWIDNNKQRVQDIKDNIKSLNLDKSNFKVFNSDFRMALKKASTKFDIIFLDPPFIENNYYEVSLTYILKKKLLTEKGIIVLEKPKKFKILQLNNYKILNSKIVGKKDIIFLGYINGQKK